MLYIIYSDNKRLISGLCVLVDASKLLFDAQRGDYKVAPSKETLSFRSYAAKRRLNRLRRNACLLFQVNLAPVII
jgi:hypothetical protein